MVKIFVERFEPGWFYWKSAMCGISGVGAERKLCNDRRRTPYVTVDTRWVMGVRKLPCIYSNILETLGTGIRECHRGEAPDLKSPIGSGRFTTRPPVNTLALCLSSVLLS